MRRCSAWCRRTDATCRRGAHHGASGRSTRCRTPLPQPLQTCRPITRCGVAGSLVGPVQSPISTTNVPTARCPSGKSGDRGSGAAGRWRVFGAEAQAAQSRCGTRGSELPTPQTPNRQSDRPVRPERRKRRAHTTAHRTARRRSAYCAAGPPCPPACGRDFAHRPNPDRNRRAGDWRLTAGRAAAGFISRQQGNRCQRDGVFVRPDGCADIRAQAGPGGPALRTTRSSWANRFGSVEPVAPPRPGRLTHTPPIYNHRLCTIVKYTR